MTETLDINLSDLRRIADQILVRHEYDFRDYAKSSFKRRVLRIMDIKRLSVESLIEKIAHHPAFIDEFLDELTVNVTEMFRDPTFWMVMRDTIIPAIRKQKEQIRIWHAGCSSGEEVFSMAILLHEMGILKDVQILATDLDTGVLKNAASGAFVLKRMEDNSRNYDSLPWKGAFSDYYVEQGGLAVFDTNLISNVTFQNHDLVTEEPEGRFDLIVCRNVMIYFNQALQNNVLNKFHRCLNNAGYLAIGSKESLIWCDAANKFATEDGEEKIYRKVKD